MMKLENLEFIKLLPRFMQEDSAVRGLAAGVDALVPDLVAAMKRLTVWDNIDDLTETELDEMAWELNIPWYDVTADVSIKREIVRNSDQVYRHLGTKAAVENVIKTYFGDGHVEEWFEYGGEPGRFRVHSNNPALTEEKMGEFLKLLNKVKRASSKLDTITITISAQSNVYAGVAIHEMTTERYEIGAVLT